ncbi:MAG: hypothetical protein JW729_06760 [Bacteroidales bacterium]|nr:hypothetical protein [Bacteroidales bacterium]
MSIKNKSKTKNRFRIFQFKLSYRQFQSLQNYSAIQKSTPIKVVKERINDCIEDYSDAQIGKDKSAKNQLDLFERIPPEEQQLELFN